MDDTAVKTMALAPGETTTEGQNTENATWWAKLMIILGLVGTFAPQMIDAMKQIPGVETSKTGTIIISALGIVVMISGSLLKGQVVSSYNASRGLVKAAAVSSTADKIVAAVVPTPPPAV